MTTINIEMMHCDMYLKGHYEPGNGTSYRAIAVRWRDAEYQQHLGTISDGWLVVSCNTGRAYLFQAHEPLADNYIREHLGGLPGDYPHFGNLIRRLINRPNYYPDDMPDDIEAYRNERAERMP